MAMAADIIGGVKIRWITTNCFEIVLPSGRVILTDPYITDSPNKCFSPAEVSGADYMLITHTHFDHINDVEKLADRFKSQVFTGALSAVELCKLCHLPAERIYLMRSGDRYVFEDCSIEAIASRHIVLPPDGTRFGNHPEMERLNRQLKRPAEEDTAFWYGCLEQLSYLITARDGTSILLWGGQATDEQINRLRGLKPTLAIFQATGNPAPDISQLIGAIEPQIAIPHHHDFLELLVESGLKIPGGLNSDMILREIARHMKADAPYTRFIKLERGEWYCLGAVFFKFPP